MLADFLYQYYPYQIFKSILFRGGMGYLTSYFLITFLIPSIIRKFRVKGITADFKKNEGESGPYSGATPIMGGVILILAILMSALLWVWMNPFIYVLIILISSFGLIGLVDDYAKVNHKRKIDTGVEEKKTYALKADGISAKLRISLEFVIATLVVILLHYLSKGGLDSHLYIPGFPTKNWYPEIPLIYFIPFAIVFIVTGSNAVNLTDGLDSLATVPLLTCSLFVAAAAYISGDIDLSQKLKFFYIGEEIKEVVIFATIIMGTCVAFLQFNSPPASIYMGDVGSLGIGAAVTAMFIMVKAELILPIVGGTFFIAGLSVVIQVVWFKIVLILYGRKVAEKNRFFFRAPYHHHQQAVINYNRGHASSNYHNLLNRLGLARILDADKYSNKDSINNKVIWKNHIKAIWFLVIALVIYIKVR